jgi:hypothetical protein
VSRVLRDSLLVAFLSDRRVDSQRISKIEFIQPVYYVHYIKLMNENDLDKELLTWIKASYKIGMREHIKVKNKK